MANMQLRGRRSQPPADFRVRADGPRVIPDPATLPMWWHPDRAGVRSAPAWFTRRLEEIDPDLACTWDALRERWVLWARVPTVQNRVCPGWRLLFSVGGHQLDNRVFGMIARVSARAWGNAKAYWAALEREYEADKARKAKQDSQDTMDAALEHFDHSQIKVSMCGPSSGSKFSEFHS